MSAPSSRERRADGAGQPCLRVWASAGLSASCVQDGVAVLAHAWVERLLSGRVGPWLRERVIPGDDNSAELTRVRGELDQLGARRLPRTEMLAETARLYDELERLEAMPQTPTRTVREVSGISEGERWRGLDMTQRRELLLSGEVRVYVSSYGHGYGVQADFDDAADDLPDDEMGVA
jgi:hypothetical protein